ncbi:tyrosine-type recombinase/integrase [Vibrio sp. WJH972]
MNTVQAIKDKNDVVLLLKFIEKNYSSVVYDVVRLGFNIPLRISDLLNLHKDNISECGCYIEFTAKKTNKTDRFPLNESAQNVIQRRLKQMPLSSDTFLFIGDSNRSRSSQKPVSRQYISRVLKEAGEVINVEVGTHSFRKTWGYHYYTTNNDLAMVQRVLQHRSSAETLRYIGIEQDDIDEAITSISF